MDQDNQVDNQTKEGSKKGLYITIVVVVILVGWYLSRGSFGMMGAVNGVNVKQSLDGSATYSTKDGSVTVGSNKLPDNWPSDAPTYANAAIQYSGSSNPQTGEKGLSVVFTTSDSAQKVADFYKSELASKGWVVEQTANMGASTILSAKKDTRTFSAYVVDAGDGQVSVSIGIVIPN